MPSLRSLAPYGSRPRLWARKLSSASACTRRRLRAESSSLRRAWADHAPHDLDEYLVSGYQSPLINAQSILTRHTLIRALSGTRHQDLMQEELKFCVEANEVIREHAASLGIGMGAFLDPRKRRQVNEVTKAISHWEGTYEALWSERLQAESTHRRLRVLELGCGSANDYRFFASYGLARLIDYTGVDVTEANIDNATRRFPSTTFLVADMLNMQFRRGAYDYVVASDVFEHLSAQAIEYVLRKTARSTTNGVIFNFFRMEDRPYHDVRRTASKHQTTVSNPRVLQVLRKSRLSAASHQIHSLLRDSYGYRKTYNKKAWTVIATHRRAGSDQSEVIAPTRSQP